MLCIFIRGFRADLINQNISAAAEFNEFIES